jgi:hypothetical protein
MSNSIEKDKYPSNETYLGMCFSNSSNRMQDSLGGSKFRMHCTPHRNLARFQEILLGFVVLNNSPAKMSL